MDKASHFLRFRQILEDRLRTVEASIADARSSMRVDGGFRPENRGERAAVTTQGYLAAGLNRRAGEIKQALELLEQVDPGPRDQVAPGALVITADSQELQRAYLLLPGGQGDRLDHPEHPLTVISPSAPIAQALRGQSEGDEARVVLDGRTVQIEIIAVR